jgi:hypothetical protein
LGQHYLQDGWGTALMTLDDFIAQHMCQPRPAAAAAAGSACPGVAAVEVAAGETDLQEGWGTSLMTLDDFIAQHMCQPAHAAAAWTGAGCASPASAAAKMAAGEKHLGIVLCTMVLPPLRMLATVQIVSAGMQLVV